jgi:hypothetical protein
MISLAADCLVFKLASGERIPFSAEMVSVDFMGESAQTYDPEFLRHATSAVFHYFKHDLGRQTVSVAEFAEALEKVLHGFSPGKPTAVQACDGEVAVSDLCRLVRESEGECELFFFPRLREELRQQLLRNPRLVRFEGLRACVKRLTGARRWTPRCQGLEEQIVDFLRECLGAEAKQKEFALVVE